MLLMIMGVLSRPFSLIGLVCKANKYNITVKIAFFLLCLCAFSLALLVVSSKSQYSFPNLFVKTIIKLFISYCLFTPFEQLFLYMKDGIKRGSVKLSIVITYIVFCIFIVFLNATMK